MPSTIVTGSTRWLWWADKMDFQEKCENYKEKCAEV
jgi:hypothetical protein